MFSSSSPRGPLTRKLMVSEYNILGRLRNIELIPELSSDGQNVLDIFMLSLLSATIRPRFSVMAKKVINLKLSI